MLKEIGLPCSNNVHRQFSTVANDTRNALKVPGEAIIEGTFKENSAVYQVF